MSTPINSYSFFLNTSSNNFTNGSSWSIPLPTNISVSNPANSFSAFITEASIPQTAFIVSDQIGNNTFEFKLQVYVDKVTSYGQILEVDKWMDCTDVQKQYLDSVNLGAGVWIQAFATNPNSPPVAVYNGPSNWCDFEANKVTVANGNYNTNIGLINAVTAALTQAMNSLNNRMTAVGHYYNPQSASNISNTIVLSGTDKSILTIEMQNLWGVTANSFSANTEIIFKNYRLYVKSNEIFSMLGFNDRDITFEFSDCSPQFMGSFPSYTAQLNPTSYVSPHIMNLDPNVNYYINFLNLSQLKSFTAVNGSAITTQSFGGVFRSFTGRSEIYYSLPTVIQIQDKNFNFLELNIKDYRNRTIPTILFPSPIYLTIVFQEIQSPQATNAINLQQLNDIDAVFWRQKELELQFELESFITTKRN